VIARNDSPDERPWYREFWPWALMVPPLLSIAGGVAMVLLATGTPSALVVEDYARIEELTSERFGRDEAARSLALTAEVSFRRESGEVDVSLVGSSTYQLPEKLILALRHVTDPAADIEIALVRSEGGFTARADVPRGPFHIELLPQSRNWRLGAGPGYLDGVIVLRPQSGVIDAAGR
jgi:hypothetical protein